VSIEKTGWLEITIKKKGKCPTENSSIHKFRRLRCCIDFLEIVAIPYDVYQFVWD
jgi:hypothetical protein